MIYKNIYNQIKTVLETVEEVKEIFTHPTSNFTKYPAVVFFPAGVSNVYSTTNENFREYPFKLYIVIGVNQSTMEKVFTEIMPGACDAVLSAFDTAWSLTDINGKRTWLTIDSGDWSIDSSGKGLLAVAELNVKIKLSVDL